MNSILLLTRLQITQSFGAIRAAIEKRAGANGAMAGTALIGLMLLGGIGWVGYTAYGLVGHIGLAKTIYNILFMACGLLTFTFSLPTVLSTFFGSSDINDLLPLPVSPFAIVLSKTLNVLTASYLWTFLFIAAPLAGWGIAAVASMRYWVVYVLAIVFAPMMPTAYAGTLSILIATVFKRVRRKDAITTLTTVISLGLSVGLHEEDPAFIASWRFPPTGLPSTPSCMPTRWEHGCSYCFHLRRLPSSSSWHVCSICAL